MVEENVIQPSTFQDKLRQFDSDSILRYHKIDKLFLSSDRHLRFSSKML
jgi:hypothetical protein